MDFRIKNYQDQVDTIYHLFEKYCDCIQDEISESEISNLSIREEWLTTFTEQYFPQVLPSLYELFEYVHQKTNNYDEDTIYGLIESVRNNIQSDEYRHEKNRIYTNNDTSNDRDLMEDQYSNGYTLQALYRYEKDLPDYLSDDYIDDTPLIERNLLSDEIKQQQQIWKIQKAERHRARAELIEKIRSYIVNSDKPINKDQIISIFPGATVPIIVKAIRNRRNILEYKNQTYINYEKLDVTQEEISHLRDDLATLLLDGNIHDLKKIYQQYIRSNSAFLDKIYAEDQYNLFSFIERQFRSVYNFDRPFIAPKIRQITPLHLLVREEFMNRRTFTFNDVNAYCENRDTRLNITLIKFINAVNDIFLMKDKNTFIKAEDLGINEEIANELTNKIIGELEENGIMAIREIKCIADFPQIVVPWDEWLIYSTLLRWSDEIHVFTSSPRFNKAIPIISTDLHPSNEILNQIGEIQANYDYDSSKLVFDDLSNLDALIEDEIEDEWDDEEMSFSDSDDEQTFEDFEDNE